MILSNAGFLSLFLGLISSFAVFLCTVLNIKKNLLNLEKKTFMKAKHSPKIKE